MDGISFTHKVRLIDSFLFKVYYKKYNFKKKYFL